MCGVSVSINKPPGVTVHPANDNLILIDGRPVAVSSESDPAAVDWAAAGAEYVVDASGGGCSQVEFGLTHGLKDAWFRTMNHAYDNFYFYFKCFEYPFRIEPVPLHGGKFVTAEAAGAHLASGAKKAGPTV